MRIGFEEMVERRTGSAVRSIPLSDVIGISSLDHTDTEIFASSRSTIASENMSWPTNESINPSLIAMPIPLTLHVHDSCCSCVHSEETRCWRPESCHYDCHI